MTDASDDTVRITRTDAVDESTSPRRSAPADREHPDGFTGGITDDGSTVVARRESRRRQGRAAVAAVSPVPPGHDGSSAVPPPLPVGSGPTISPVRSPAPVIAARATPAPRDPQVVIDTVAVDAARRRRSRRVTLTVVAAAAALVVLAAAALIVLLAIG